MRLIDVEPIIEDLEREVELCNGALDNMDIVSNTRENLYVERNTIQDLVQELKDEPTIDAVPVKHGEWIIDGEFIDCSACKQEKWSRVPYEDLVKRFKFCPNCGAKMDGGKDDDKR